MANAVDNMIVGLDIGTSKVVAIVGQITEEGVVEVVGLGSQPSRGMKKGVVVDIEATVRSIQRAVEEAELMAGCQIHSVYAGIAGSHVRSLNSHGIVAIRDREVTQADIDRVIDAAQAVAIPADQKTLHVLPQEYVVDNQEGVREPVGMSGVRLEAKVHLVTCAVNAVQNIEKCVRRCGLEVEDVILEQLASAHSVLTEDERELGVLLYAEHLRSMVESAAGAEVPLLLSTVADHTRSYAFHGDPPPLSAGVAEGVQALDAAGRSRDTAAIDSTLRSLESKLKTQADHHAVARLLDRDQYWSKAKPYFETAEYLDPRPRRSSVPMRNTVRTVTEETNTPLCDVAAELAQQAFGGVSGDEFFFDPCHPNPLGHRRIAEILIRCTLEQGLINADGSRLDDVLKSLPLEGGDPMRLDHYAVRRAQLEENRAMSESEINTAIRSQDDGTPIGAATAGHQAVLFGLYRGALAWYDLAESRGEESAGLWLSKGLVLQHLHDINGAREAIDNAAVMAPDDLEIHQFRAVLGDG